VRERQRSTLNVHDLAQTRDARNRWASLEQFDPRPHGVGQQLVIRVEEDDKLSPCHLKASIAGCAEAGIPLSSQAHPGCGGNLRRFVCRPIVDDDDFNWCVSLPADAGYRVVQEACLVEAGNSD
jgi:hypothetical protein